MKIISKIKELRAEYQAFAEAERQRMEAQTPSSDGEPVLLPYTIPKPTKEQLALEEQGRRDCDAWAAANFRNGKYLGGD